METLFVERDCVVEHDGKRFTADGAAVTPTHLRAYIGAELRPGVFDVTGWAGASIGLARVTSSWPIRSYLGSRMYAFRVTLASGAVYFCRGMGSQMVCFGRRQASQLRGSL